MASRCGRAVRTDTINPTPNGRSLPEKFLGSSCADSLPPHRCLRGCAGARISPYGGMYGALLQVLHIGAATIVFLVCCDFLLLKELEQNCNANKHGLGNEERKHPEQSALHRQWVVLWSVADVAGSALVEDDRKMRIRLGFD